MFDYQNNTLYCEQVKLSELADEYGTPLYVYSQQTITANYQVFHQAFDKHPHLICYAVKANSNLSVLSTLAKQGSGFDVVSGGELARVLAAGGYAQSCVFSGVAKSRADITYALEQDILCFNVESNAELLRIAQIAKNLGKVAPISLRINPNVDANTHPYISTGLKDNKFGVDIEEALMLYQTAEQLNSIEIKGIGCHIGSQITTISPFLDALDRVIELVFQLEARGIELSHIDLGGGMGIIYEDNEQAFDTKKYIQAILKKVTKYKIILEPGRAIVGNAGVFLTQVEFLKQTPYKSFAIIDGAMNDLLRPCLYGAYHQILPLKRTEYGIKANWDIVGPVCETGDFLGKNRYLSLNEGDILAIMSAGAYGFVMSSNYNTRPRSAEVMVDGTTHRLIRQRETIEDLLAYET